VSAYSTLLEQIADQIRDAVNDGDWDVQVEPRLVVNPTTPSIDMFPGPLNSDLGAFASDYAGAADGLFVDVRARVSPKDSHAFQDVLVSFCDPEDDLCVVQSLYDDPTLGGHAADVALVSQSEFQPAPSLDGTSWFVAVTWRFLVIPARS